MSITPDHCLSLAALALDFGRVNRATRHEDGQTPETDTTHTVMLSLLACEIANRVGDFDVGLVAQYALVHDLVEARTPGGDTNSFDIGADAAADKAKREAVGLERLHAEFAGTWMFDRLLEYEAQSVREARLVRYLDKVTPKLTHALNGCAAIQGMGKSFEDLVRAHREQGEKLRADYPELAPVVGPVFDELCAVSEQAWRGAR